MADQCEGGKQSGRTSAYNDYRYFTADIRVRGNAYLFGVREVFADENFNLQTVEYLLTGINRTLDRPDMVNAAFRYPKAG